jgi:outer membrane lipoprotein-sorting protein
MKKILLITAFGILACCGGYSLTPGDILEKVDENRSVSTNFEMQVDLENYQKGKLSDSAVFKGFVKGLDKSMVIYTHPASMKGRKILMIKDDTWIFIPDTKKPVRLTASQRLLGQASNEDVLKIRFSYDYQAELLGEEGIADIDSNNRNCYKLDLTARRSGTAYHKMTLWVEKETFYPVKAEFFALSGKKLKTAMYSGLKEIDGRDIVTKTTIYDEVMKDDFTTIENSDLKKSDVEDRYFNKEYLQRM